MPRQKATSPRSEQLLIRVTEEELDILDAAGFLDRLTANSYVYQLIQAHVAALRSNPAVMNAVRLRADYDASKGKALTIERREGPADNPLDSIGEPTA